MLYVYGVGAQVDLPNFSVVVTGLDAWDQQRDPIDEPRLLAVVRRELGEQVERLVAFPWLAGDNKPESEAARVGVPVVPFPRWMRCPLCSTLTTIDSGTFAFKAELYRPERSRFVHEQCPRKGKRAPNVIPARFVVACSRGHLDEFPWMEFVHRFQPCPKASEGARLEMYDRGSGTRSTDVVVKCCKCEQQQTLGNVFGPGAAAPGSFIKCRGRRPELREFEPNCAALPEPMLLGASNLWFSISRSAFALPHLATDEIAALVLECWAKLDLVTDQSILTFALATIPELNPLRAFPVADVWKAIEAHRHVRSLSVDAVVDDLRRPEWEQFCNPGAAPSDDDFDVSARDVPGALEGRIRSVVAARRLREVVALIGFSRVEMPETDLLEPFVPDSTRISLSAKPPRWIPAVEVRGEGIFLRFDEGAVERWAMASEKSLQLTAMRNEHTRRSKSPWPGVRYVLLHSFAHLVTNEVALDCGYSAASIRERIYSADPREGEPMAGVLLYTSSPDAEGTLGGLVSLAEPERLAYIVRMALERARLCGSDPLCADHVPELDETTLHGSACHSCLLLPETSCERNNRYLDRTVLVPTLADAGIGYFA